MKEQKGNFSNDGKDTFDPRKKYVGVRLQQGVPLLDRDWNELEDIRRYEEAMLRRWYIGNGSPDDGFKISAVEPEANDFKIVAGRCLVDGFEAVNEKDLLYSEQDGVAELTKPTAKRVDLVYLDLWIGEITSREDDDLKNSDDVNVETCVRHRLEWRVRVAEGSEKYVREEFHHYYDIARVTWTAGEDIIPNASIQDIRRTGLALHLLKDVTAGLTDNSVVDTLHRHSKLVASDGSPDPALSVDKAGNVGIGTVDPKDKLDVRGTITTSGSNIELTQQASGNRYSYIDFHGDDTYTNYGLRVIRYNTGANAESRIHHRGTGILRLYTQESRSHIVLQPGGNVGIGISKPEADLHVDGDMRIGTSKTPRRLTIYGPKNSDTYDGALIVRWSTSPIYLRIDHNEIDCTQNLYLNYYSKRRVQVGSDTDGAGGMKVFGNLRVTGNISAGGGKGGYVTDRFVNQSGDVLEQGDVVILSRKSAKIYCGVEDNIPVPDADLTSDVYDRRVCGIVSEIVVEEEPEFPEGEEEIQAKNKPRRDVKGYGVFDDGVKRLQVFSANELEKLDIKKIGKGQIGEMVTMGCFAHCKVDADIFSIEVGDLLTTSPTKGHAQKVLEPEKAIGAIIGKALGSLKKGKEKIPILVVLQ
jgi:hypothetical protein